MKNKFEAFLRKHKVLTEFKRLVKTQFHQSLEQFIDDSSDNLDIKGMVFYLDFEDSKRPFKFWSNLNECWEKELKSTKL